MFMIMINEFLKYLDCSELSILVVDINLLFINIYNF